MKKVVHAIWVTRWDYKKPKDVEIILKNCADFGFNLVMFQIRGNGTAFYKSNYEPWAWELTGKDSRTLGKDPGWDPLQTAIDIAERLEIELHAYMNVYPGWRGKEVPPSKAGQLFTKHRNWFGLNEGGDYQPLSDDYITLCPEIPAVSDYLEKVFLQVVRDYDIAGIHMDYVRSYNDLGEYSLDPISIKHFKNTHHKHPLELPDSWSQWKRDAVTDLVRRISKGTKKLKKNCKVSASVWNSYYSGYSQYYQDSWKWYQEGLLDFSCPMNYTRNNALYKQWTQFHLNHSHGVDIYPGIGVLWEPEKGKKDFVLDQWKITQKLRAPGVAIFAYSCLFPKNIPNTRAEALHKALLIKP